MSNFFSLNVNSDTCKPCPEIEGFYCIGKIFLITEGYWKKDSSSETYEDCVIAPSNCIGDSDSSDIKRSYLNKLKKSPNNPMDYYCNEGN